MGRHWRSRLNSSAAPLVLATAEHANRRLAIIALANRLVTEGIQKAIDEAAKRTMTEGFCATKTTLIDGEPVFEIVEDFYE